MIHQEGSKKRHEELSANIIRVCAQCTHGKWVMGHLECDRKRSECHSKRVLKWLDEIKRLTE